MAVSMSRWLGVLARGVLAGVLLAAVEVAVVAARDRTLFLSSRELGRYALVALTCLPALGGLLAVLASLAARLLAPSESRRVLSIVVAIASAPMISALLWSLTEGRRVRALPGRAVGVVLLGVATGAALGWLVGRLLQRVRDRRKSQDPASIGARMILGGLLATAVISVLFDAIVLRRLYPAFHLGLTGLAWAAALAALALAPAPAALVARAPRSARASIGGAVAFVLLCALAFVEWNAAARFPGLRFSIEQAAPQTGKLIALRPVAPTKRQTIGTAATTQTTQAKQPTVASRVGVDLRDRDVLLVTIDALRADRLRAYGGHGLTPEIDALAAEGRVFLRAYTPTPHTSYAVMSMLTGKPLALIYALLDSTGRARDTPVTLPGLLRRHGYRTAAFYPPAIFYVDEDRFAAVAQEHIGFEYVKAQYGSGEERVAQLRGYLSGTASEDGGVADAGSVDAGPSVVEPVVRPAVAVAGEREHPIFAWVHLFEPHEPYEPPARFARGDTPEARYDGEVAAADAAVGELVRAFRALRPNATVIITADHGEEHGDHGGHHHGTTLFDEQARVPLVWSSPGSVAPGATRAPVELIDLPTTLLAALGIPKDARMQGDDLGPVLADPSAPGPAFAFASLPDLAMTTDGQLKLLCVSRTAACQMFDLDADPKERADLSATRLDDVARLRAGWDAFVSEVPRIEALDLSGQAWPVALARARLGDVSVAADLVALLAAPRAEVRAEAAAALGELHAVQARPVLARMLESESDPDVAAQVAIAALRLGHIEAHDAVVRLIEHAGPRVREGELGPQERLAAIALAHSGTAEGEGVLLAAAGSAALSEPERLAALRALAALGSAKLLSRRALPAIARLQSEVRLREEVARTFAQLGDKRAIPVLRKALRTESYPEARQAQIAALEALSEHRPSAKHP